MLAQIPCWIFFRDTASPSEGQIDRVAIGMTWGFLRRKLQQQQDSPFLRFGCV